MLASRITLRPFGEQDGRALADLSATSADGGALSFTAVYQVEPFQALKAIHGDPAGVIACAPDRDGLVGVSLMRFGRCQYESAERPYALINTLMVHPDFRRQGIAGQMTAWQVHFIRENYGPDAVILANIQQGNTASHKTFLHYCPQRLEPFIYLPLKALGAPPRPLEGYTVRPAEVSEFGEIAAELNALYHEYNLFPHQTAQHLAVWCAESPLETPIHHYLVVTDAHGRIQAGLAVTEEYRLRTIRLVQMPDPLRLLNHFMQIVPADGLLRELYLDRIWFNPGFEPAARFLIDTVRWEWRDRATNVGFFFDPRGALRRILPMQPWTPSTKMSIVVQASPAISPGRFVYPLY